MVGHGPHVKKAWPLRLFGGGDLPAGRRDLSGLALQARLWLDGTDAAKRTLIGVRPKKPSVVFMVNTNKASPSRPTRRDPQNPNSIEPSRGRNPPAVGKNKDPRFARTGGFPVFSYSAQGCAASREGGKLIPGPPAYPVGQQPGAFYAGRPTPSNRSCSLPSATVPA